MKKIILLTIVLVVLTIGTVFAAKYQVNSSGTVKTQSGTIISPISNSVNQNFYNNYQASSYIASNQVKAANIGIIEIVMDYSGSMANWIEVAKRSMSAIVAQIPPSTKVGFRVFGHSNYGKNTSNNDTHREIEKIVKKSGKYQILTATKCLGTTSGACGATELVSPIMAANSNSLISGMNSVEIGSSTPLVFALDRTIYKDLAPFGTITPKKVILITDGEESCGGDPCAFAKQLMNKRSDVHIDVVLVSSSSKKLACLANTTGGRFYTINNLSDFSAIINQSIQAPVSASPSSVENAKPKYEYIGN